MASLFANSCAILLFKCITFADKNIVAAPKIVSSFTGLFLEKNNREASHDGSLCSRNKFCKTTNPNLNK